MTAFSFGGDDEDESAADSAASEESEESDEIGSDDSFFGFEEESAAVAETAEAEDESEPEDEFALSLDTDDDAGDDEFALSFDEEDSAADELSAFSFGGDDEDDGATVSAALEKSEESEESDEIGSDDSFFGFEEESAAVAETAEAEDESEPEDEFALSLDTDDDAGDDEFALSFDEEDPAADELSAFSFGDEDEDESAAAFEESDELVLTPDDEEDDVDLNLDANLLEPDQGEAEISLEDNTDIIPEEEGAAAEALPNDEILLDQEFEHQQDRGEIREAVPHDGEPEAEEEETALVFDAALFASAAAAVSTIPSLENIRHINELATAAKKATGGATPQQTVILHLLESATALIGQKPEPDTEDQVVVQELAAGLELAETDPFELMALVQDYTAWEQEFFRSIMTSKGNDVLPHAGSPIPVISDSISSKDAVYQVQQGFSQLRQAMMEEFNQLRKELQQR